MTGPGEPVRLRSKRNRVEKVPFPLGKGTVWSVRKDFGENREGYRTELAMSELLAGAGVPVAPILRAEEPVITYRWLEGGPLADLLDEAEEDPGRMALLRGALRTLCGWLEAYYAAVRSSGGGVRVLGDAHLRNFLLLEDGGVAGVDFECCRPGRPEEDVARLAAFTLTYDPARTPGKQELAALLCRECQNRLGLDEALLEQKITEELAGIARRRTPK